MDGPNEVMFQGFDSNIPVDYKQWNHLTEELEWLGHLGVKHIWIPPATKAASLTSDGYDAYDL